MRNRRAKPHAIELVGAGTKTDFYVLEAIAESNLSKRHCQELVPTGKVANLVFTVITIDTPLELLRVDEIQDLRENNTHARIVGITPAVNQSKTGSKFQIAHTQVPALSCVTARV